MNAIHNAIRATLEGQAKCDAVCKELLSNRQILSHILKAFVKEYKDCSPLEIETQYIETESVKLSAVPVERNLTNTEIIGISNEDKTVNEGSVYYDIIFKAKYPAKSGKLIVLQRTIQNPSLPPAPASRVCVPASAPLRRRGFASGPAPPAFPEQTKKDRCF